jgi:hypothetical protein
MELYLLILLGVGVLIAARPLFALSANANLDRLVDTEIREFSVGAERRIYRDALVGIDPAGYLKPFEPGDMFAGIAYEEADNSSGVAGAMPCRVRVEGDFVLPLTSVALTDTGKAVFATADNTTALKGHPDAFIGRVISRHATNYAVVRLRTWGEKPTKADTGCVAFETAFREFFAATTADGAGNGPVYANGFKHESVLGLGVHQIAGETGGVQMDFDAVAEVASATISTTDALPVDRGITFEGELHLSDDGDDAALDFDFGLGTLLTANSIASVDHTDMAQLAAFHIDGNDTTLNAQSDDATTDVSATDTTLENSLTATKKFKIIVRPAGTVEFWVDGARVLSSTAFQVLSTAALCGFVNMEKTSNDTTAVAKVYNLRVAGGQA